ncbi:MAG: hypothetical protein FD156_1191 [Nitrospirae bacterium]|nr:MAG: hypothetical protein FD156_1191 [Nitrospirota bacterium]
MQNNKTLREICSEIEVNVKRISTSISEMSKSIYEMYFMLMCFAVMMAFCIGMLVGGEIISRKYKNAVIPAEAGIQKKVDARLQSSGMTTKEGGN